MSARLRVLPILALLLACSAQAAPPRKAAGVAVAPDSLASGGSSRERGSLAATRAPRSQASSAHPDARPKVAPRTLDDIHIEGEIPVPQVLFITARDQRRFLEFQHHRYRRTSLELGRATPTPSRLVIAGPPPAPRKENP